MSTWFGRDLPTHLKPRMRQAANGWWELRPPRPIAPHYHEVYISLFGYAAYAHWVHDVRVYYDLK